METEAQVGWENCQGYINCPIVESRFKSVFSDLGVPVLNHHYCYSWFIFWGDCDLVSLNYKGQGNHTSIMAM